uniref:NR LBD domain-containing protein n=1 Tax=Steinernema glaseri TaxID=37863 RepID=A0A1I8A0K6_9BILA
MSDLDHCLVCGDPAHGVHFQVNSCRACAAFFRRAVPVASSYKCRRATKTYPSEEETEVSKDIRRLKQASSKAVESVAPVGTEESPNYPSCSASNVSIEKDSQILSEQQLIQQVTDILNRPATPVPQTMGIRPTAMQRLQYAFRAMYVGPQKEVKMIDKLEIPKLMESHGPMMVNVVKWAMACEEFADLTWNDKWLMFKRLWPQFHTIERVNKTIEVMGANMDSHYFLVDDHNVVNLERMTYEIPDLSNETQNKLISLFKPHKDMLQKNVLCPMKELQFSEYEVVYLLAQIMWSIKSVPGLSEQAVEVADKYLDLISNEIHNYYVYERRMENYAGRLAQLMKIQTEVERQILYLKDLIKVAGVFDLFTCDLSESELLKADFYK